MSLLDTQIDTFPNEVFLLTRPVGSLALPALIEAVVGLERVRLSWCIKGVRARSV